MLQPTNDPFAALQGALAPQYRRDQGGPSRAGCSPLDRPQVPGRGPHHRAAAAPEHRRRPRRGYGRWTALLCDGRGGGREPPGSARPRGEAADRGGHPDRGGSGLRARRSRQGRRRPPRREAGERPARAGHRPGAPRRLRHRARDGGGCRQQHRPGRRGRYSRLHEPGAGRRRGGGQPERPVRIGCRRLRDARRASALPGHQSRRGLQTHRRASPSDRAAPGGVPEGAGGRRDESAGKAPRGAVADRGGAPSGRRRRADAAGRPIAAPGRGNRRCGGRSSRPRHHDRTGKAGRRPAGRRESAAFHPGAAVRQPA
jgi:hypothetical protein